MTLIQTPQEIFADAKAVQASALERVAAGDICDGAKKAWCATKRATEALLLGSVDISATLQWVYVKCHHISKTMAEDSPIPAEMS